MMNLQFSIYFFALTAQHEDAYEMLLEKDQLQAARVGKDQVGGKHTVKKVDPGQGYPALARRIEGGSQDAKFRFQWRFRPSDTDSEDEGHNTKERWSHCNMTWETFFDEQLDRCTRKTI